MSIADNLQRLIIAKTDIQNAIVTMGGTVGEDDGLEDYANDVLTIPVGGKINVGISNISTSLSSSSTTMSANTTNLLLCDAINMSSYTEQLASAGAYLEWSAHLDCYFRRNSTNYPVTITCGFQYGSTNLSEYYTRTIPRRDTTNTISDDLNYQTTITGSGSLKLACSATTTSSSYPFLSTSRISLTNISCKLIIPN